MVKQVICQVRGKPIWFVFQGILCHPYQPAHLFVLFNSAFTFHIASGEITDYVFLSLINIIIVVSVRSKVDLIIGKDLLKKGNICI